MDLLNKDKKYIENTNELGRALVALIEENLNPKGWGFTQSFINFAKSSGQVVIYDSIWCRIRFSFSRQRSPEYDELSIYYGRLHALNEEPYMEWKGKKCRCWHELWEPLRYLDGLSPSDAVQQSELLKQLPTVVENFWNSDQAKILREVYPPKHGIVLHSKLWQHYGQRLFDLFDLQRPDLWDEYQKFLAEYYRLLGKKVIYGPPYENVC
jgi:hypothetical protein